MGILRGGKGRADAETIRLAHRHFDGNTCSCFSGKDKCLMLQIIKAAFGDMEEFNKVVRTRLDEALFRELIPLEDDSDIDTSEDEDSVEDELVSDETEYNS